MSIHGNLSKRPPLDGTVHIDTQEPSAQPSSSNNNDVAGVLRRNQACLQCRRRKLKCDAARPHCATCVRSYRHLLRTSPKSNPVLCCDYDDGASNQVEEGDSQNKSNAGPAGAPANEEEETSGIANGSKKKRKATGEGRRKKKEEEFEEERDRLTKQIQELQARLADKPRIPAPAFSSSLFQNATAPSPNTFINFFTSNPSQPASNSQADPMWGNYDPLEQIQSQHTHLVNLGSSSANVSHCSGGPSPANQASETSRRSSSLHNNTSTPNLTSGESSSGANILSPGEIFNFSPADISNDAWKGAVPDTNDQNKSQNWQSFNPNDLSSTVDPLKGQPQWQSLESVSATFTTTVDGNVGRDLQMETEINMDGLEAGLDAAMQQQILMDLFWPGWPAKLPEPNVVNDLIESFFDQIPNLPRILHRPRFLARMALPPTHSNFPHPALIHAICAAAAARCPEEVYSKSTRDKQWEKLEFSVGCISDSESVRTGFGLRQTMFAKEAVQDGLNTGNRLFDVVRAMIILCRVFIDDTRMLECWAYAGLVARMILPLGLNVRSAELSLKSVMLPPPLDALEREERRATVWMAFYHDTVASAASGWGTSMSLDELTVALPVSAKEFENGSEFMESNSQDAESPDLFLKHPVVDSFVMVTKATILLNRANRFVRKWKNRHLRPNDDMDGMDKPEFRELANSIACFQMSFPSALRNACKLNSRRRLDADLVAAHLIPHSATICLYEPFADLDNPSDQPTRRLLSATQGIVGIVQQLASAVGGEGEKFASVMHSSASVCFVTAARTSLLFMRHALNNGDEVSASSHHTDCDMVRLALSYFGASFKIGQHHAQLIEYFLDRAANPTFEKLLAHYPDHPRPGVPALTRDADFGSCVENALNVKRGYWRIKTRPSFSGTGFDEYSANSGHSHSYPGFSQAQTYINNKFNPPSGPGVAGISPIGSGNTPESQGNDGSGTGSGVGGASLKDISMDSSPAPGLNSGSGASAPAGGGQGAADLWHDQFYALDDQYAADSSRAQQSSSTQKVEYMNSVSAQCPTDLSKQPAPVPTLMPESEATPTRLTSFISETNNVINITGLGSGMNKGDDGLRWVKDHMNKYPWSENERK
ncbi:hypothetical protein C356_01070 [Cryptococcus neoformans c45]|nr:hypothetical protein C356_01070 [Cryptococcus neoformans var. grubii c45]